MAESNYEKGPELDAGVRSAVGIAGDIFQKRYVKATIDTLLGLKNIAFMAICIVAPIIFSIISLPQVILSTGESLIDFASFMTVFAEIKEETGSYFQESFNKAKIKAIEKGNDYASLLGEDYVIDLQVETPHGNNLVDISDNEICNILAIHGVVSQYDETSEYNDITVTTYESVEKLGSDMLSEKKFLNEVKRYAADAYSVSNPEYTELSAWSKRVYLFDEEGNPVIDSETGEQAYTEKLMHEGTVTVKIEHQGDRFYENKIIKIKEDRWADYQKTHSNENGKVDKTLTEIYADIEDEISTMESFMISIVTRSEEENGLAQVTSGRRSSRAGTITRFIGTDKYLTNMNNMVSLVYPYSEDKRTSGYGYRSLDGWHDGIDYSWTNCRLRDIPAAGDGVIAYAYGGCTVDKNSSYGFGNLIIIYHGQVNGTDVFTLYGHCERVDVKTGDSVTKGQVIGGIGQRGNSTGYHLHFEVNTRSNGKTAAVNPALYIS